MRLSIAYEDAIGIICVPLLALTASVQSKMEDFHPSYGPVLVVHLAKHCTGSTTHKSLVNLLVLVRKNTMN